MNGVVLMTAMVPTIGHQALIDFAIAHCSSVDVRQSMVHVIVSTRSHEPFIVERIRALKSYYGDHWYINIIQHADDNAPQNPKNDNDIEFWNYWKQTITRLVNENYDDLEDDEDESIDFVYASEPYGQKVADALGAKFIPFDIKRELFPVKGSTVRESPFNHYDEILCTAQHHFRTRVTIFGAESVGKTTLARATAKAYNGKFVPEWARGYLETHKDGVEVTAEKMEDIMYGQFALQRSATGRLVVQDTDLLSTIGYYGIFGTTKHKDIDELFDQSRSDLYIMLKSEIPFEVDPLRYGGDERESTDQYWIDLLEKYECNYVVLDVLQTDDKETNINMRVEKVIEHINEFVTQRDAAIINFVRE